MNTQASRTLKKLMTAHPITESELSRQTKVPQPTIHRILTGESKDPRPANLTKIAKYFGISIDAFLPGGNVDIKSLNTPNPDGVKLEYYEEASFSMGAGTLAEVNEYQIKSFETTKRWMNNKLSKVSALKNVKIITGLGDSMSGLYEDGDALFCDTGVTKVDIDAVFAFRYNEELYIKRVQRIPGGRLKMISDNPRYDPFIVDHVEKQDFQVLGRIVGTLNFNET